MSNAEMTKIEADAKAVVAKIEAWFKKHFEGGSIEANPEHFAAACAAKEELKTIVTSVAAAPAAPATPTPSPAPSPSPAPGATS